MVFDTNKTLDKEYHYVKLMCGSDKTKKLMLTKCFSSVDFLFLRIRPNTEL